MKDNKKPRQLGRGFIGSDTLHMEHTNKNIKSQQPPRAGYYRQRATSELRYIPGRDGVEIVELLLPSGPRRLGSIHVEGRTFKSNRKKSHILKSGNAICLNENLLTSDRFDWITIYVSGHPASPFVTSVDYFLAHGSRVCYTSAGFEVQISLPLDKWGIHKARQFHAEKLSQRNLFNGDHNE